MDADAFSKANGADEYFRKYLNTLSGGKAELEGFQEYLKKANVNLDANAQAARRAAAGMKILSTALNTTVAMIAINLIITGISKAAEAIDNYVHRVERAHEEAVEAADEYKQVQDEISSINSELETTNQRINELKAQESLTFVEQDELKRLQETNSELERNLKIKEALAESKYSEARSEALDYFELEKNEYIRDYEIQRSGPRNWQHVYAGGGYEKVTPIEYAEKELESYQSLLKYIQDTKQEISRLQEDHPEDFLTNKDYQEKAHLLEELERYATKVQTTLSDFYEAFDAVDDNLSPNEDAELINQLDNFYTNLAEALGVGGSEATKSFDEIWDSKEFSKYRHGLERLAKYSKVTPEVLNSNEEYKRLIDETGRSAEDVAQHINSMYSGASNQISNDTSYGETITKLESMTDAFKALDTAYSHFLDKDSEITFDDISSINEQFSEVPGIENYVKAIQDAKGNSEATQIAFDNLTSAYLEQTGVLDIVNEKNAALIQSYLDEIGITNSAALVQNALAQSMDEVAAEKWYAANASIDLSNATADEIQGLIDSGEYANIATGALIKLVAEKIVANNTGLVTSGDIENLKALAKQAGATAGAISLAYGQLPDGVAGPPLPPDMVADNLVDLINTLADADYGSGSIPNYKGSKLNKDDSKKSAKPTELDAAAESVKNLKTELDNLNNTLEDTDPYSKKLPIIQQLIAKQQEYNAALQSQANLYQAEYQQALAALPANYQEMVAGHSTFDIVEIPENLKEAVSRAQDLRDKLNNVTSAIREGNNALEETKQKMFDLAQTKIDNDIGLLENQTTDIQNQIAEAEAMGLSATEGQYQQLISLSQREASNYQNKLQGYLAEMKRLEVTGQIDTDRYYELASAAQDCENAISECTQNQAEWNKAILELPIEYLNRELDEYNDKLDELQQQQDDYDSAISGVVGHLEDQIEAQEKLRDEAEETYQKQIDAIQEQADAIQDEIDALQKANEEREQQLALEQAQYDLERAKNQKTNRVCKCPLPQ